MRSVGCLVGLAAAVVSADTNLIAPETFTYLGAAANMTVYYELESESQSTSGDLVTGSLTLDGVMGGSSYGSIETADPGLLFSGYVDLNAGGFVTFSLRGIDDKLSNTAGLVFEFDTMAASEVSQAPLAFSTDLYTSTFDEGSEGSSFKCSIFSSAIAIPVTQEAGSDIGQWYLPFDAFERPSSPSCRSASLDLSGITELSIGNIYQEGDFALHLRSLTAVSQAPASFNLPIPLPEGLDAADFVQSALDRAEYLNSKEGGFYQMTYKIFQQTSLQIAAAPGIDAEVVSVLTAAAEPIELPPDYRAASKELRAVLEGLVCGSFLQCLPCYLRRGSCGLLA